MIRLRSLPLLFFLSACAQTSSGIDWYDWIRSETLVGNMRVERDPSDPPITRQLLAENFRRIAFFVEDDSFADADRQKELNDDPILRKWTWPTRFKIYTDADNEMISDTTRSFLNRLEMLLGHQFVQGSEHLSEDELIDLFIFYGTDDFFQEVRDELASTDAEGYKREKLISLSNYIEAWRYAPSPCAGRLYASASPEHKDAPRGTILRAVVIIRKEIPRSLLETCIEEELAQIMGLPNDDPEVRPSIFNDDQEFALLTKHDEYLLRILYDDRLEAGMTPEIAMPIVRQIVAEMLPES